MAEPDSQQKLPPAAERMLREVGTKQERIARGRAHKNNNLSSIAILGVVGWSVTVPTVLGVVAGIWIDRHWPSRLSWTLTMLILGLAVGCTNAWLRIDREQR
jgi:ATP synthase protein I